MRRSALIASLTLSFAALVVACATSPAGDLTEQQLTNSPLPEQNAEVITLPAVTKDAGSPAKDSGTAKDSSAPPTSSSSSSSGSTSSGGAAAQCDPTNLVYAVAAAFELANTSPALCTAGCSSSQCCFALYNVCIAL